MGYDVFLEYVIDPLVKEGKVKYATMNEICDYFEEWEKKNPNINPTDGVPRLADTNMYHAPTMRRMFSPDMPNADFNKDGIVHEFEWIMYNRLKNRAERGGTQRRQR